MLEARQLRCFNFGLFAICRGTSRNLNKKMDSEKALYTRTFSSKERKREWGKKLHVTLGCEGRHDTRREQKRREEDKRRGENKDRREVEEREKRLLKVVISNSNKNTGL
mmetsp:Transcript_36190/g.71200  ORF Transcript_36190/g.71200 Transcript_36190/m.71200 type:complete len:109 (-) Transcript_36190:1564-1890(-)